MDCEEVRKIFSSIWTDMGYGVLLKKNFPYLAHYTSLPALESILKTNEIWLSNVSQMNDHQEQRYGVHKFWSAFLHNFELSKTFRDHLGSLAESLFFREFEQRIDLLNLGIYDEVYVFCASKHEQNDLNGRLSMWRGYDQGALGVALVLDPKKINLSRRSGIFFSKVGYLDDQKIYDWANNFASLISKIILENRSKFDKIIRLSPEKNYVSHIVDEIFNRVRLMSLFTKHPGFSEEQEWRLVMDKSVTFNEITDIHQGHKITDGSLKPVLRMKLTSQNFQLNDVIEKIIIGPSSNTKLTKIAFEAFLKTNLSDSLINKIHMSEIPYRK